MKPSIPKGTRDFSAKEIAYRSYIVNTIKQTFATFGFEPIETPSFENSETLMGKYGDEGDRLIFKILNSGDYLKDLRTNLINGSVFNSVFDILFNSFENRISIDNEFTYKNYLESALNVYEEEISHLEKDILLNFFIKNENLILDYFKEKKRISSEEDLVNSYSLKQNILREVYSNYINNIELLNSSKATSLISEKALRYDLTVPFARYVVQYQNQITFPFKRYQIQPVWRADKPQKGRFREFYQCDADVVGSNSLLQEIEFVKLYDAVFSKLKLEGVSIKINNRKILSGIAEVIGASNQLIDFTVALDKLDKIGKEGVIDEMLSKNISINAIEKVKPLFNLSGSNLKKLDALEALLSNSKEGLKGVEELRFVIDSIESLGLQTTSLLLDVTLARGLNYYTGAIFEVSAPKNVNIGSIGGGGRYDDLTGIFGLKDVSGVGISFGLDRIYLVLEELGLFNEIEIEKPQVLFLNFSENQVLKKLKIIEQLRALGIKSEIYPDTAGSNNQEKKQWKYADKREIPFVISSIENDQFHVKDRISNSQSTISFKELISLCQQ